MVYVRPYKLIVGRDYKIGHREARLIKSTPRGYNFLNLKKNEFIFKQHIYPSKESNHTKDDETWFWLPPDLKMEEVNNNIYYLYDERTTCYYYGLDGWEHQNWGNDKTHAELYNLSTVDTLYKEFIRKGFKIWIGINYGN